jgi:hypothetical protein
VTSVIKTLLTDTNLDDKIKPVYLNLIELIKKCHKVIVSDANITDNIFNLLKYRSKDDMIFINNNVKKFDNVEAIRDIDEKKFFNRMIEDVKNKQTFLFGSDCCKIVKMVYNDCIKAYEGDDKDDKFIIITSTDKFDLKDASEQFKDKFVFYSPSIVTGVDFSIDEKQKHYTYIKGRSISVLDNYQQSTRTRNMSQLVYYQRTPKVTESETLEAIEERNKDKRATSRRILAMCSEGGVNDESCIVENMYFKLESQNEYIDKVLSSNPEHYFKTILESNGFIVSTSKEAKKQLSKEEKRAKEEEIVKNIEDEWQKFLKDEMTSKNQYMAENYDTLKIKDMSKEELAKYKDVITDNHVLSHYFNFMKYCKDDDYINDRIEYLKKNTIDTKLTETV